MIKNVIKNIWKSSDCLEELTSWGDFQVKHDAWRKQWRLWVHCQCTWRGFLNNIIILITWTVVWRKDLWAWWPDHRRNDSTWRRTWLPRGFRHGGKRREKAAPPFQSWWCRVRWRVPSTTTSCPPHQLNRMSRQVFLIQANLIHNIQIKYSTLGFIKVIRANGIANACVEAQLVRRLDQFQAQIRARFAIVVCRPTQWRHRIVGL